MLFFGAETTASVADSSTSNRFVHRRYSIAARNFWELTMVLAANLVESEPHWSCKQADGFAIYYQEQLDSRVAFAESVAKGLSSLCWLPSPSSL